MPRTASPTRRGPDGSGYQGILLSPGPGVPADAGICEDLVRWATGRVPVLGVCLGHQVIAEVFGAVVDRAEELLHGRTSQLHHTGSGLFDGLPDPLTATRYHSLAVVDGTVPAELEVTARTVGRTDKLGTVGRTDELGTVGRTDELGTVGRTDELGTVGRTDELGTVGRTDELGTVGRTDECYGRGDHGLAPPAASHRRGAIPSGVGVDPGRPPAAGELAQGVWGRRCGRPGPDTRGRGGAAPAVGGLTASRRVASAELSRSQPVADPSVTVAVAVAESRR